MSDATSLHSRREYLLIILAMPEPTERIERLRAKFPSIDIHYEEQQFNIANPWKDRNDVPLEKFKEATILYTLSGLPPNPKEDAPKLELVQLFLAGVDAIAKQPVYTETDIMLATSSGVHGPQVAEWVIMTALILNHQYKRLSDGQKDHEWRQRALEWHKLHDMVGQRIGILGYGSIGRQVARLAKALGMDVLAYTATPKETKESRKDKGYIVPGTGDPEGEIPSSWYSGLDRDSLHRFLSQDLDMLVICVPLTDETRHFIGKEEFSILKKRKTLISNISRGQIIDQEAMIEALRNEDIRGAALDVTDPEPLPKDNPLWDFDNVVITPHISGISSSYSERSFAIFEENLERRAKGESLLNVVDRRRGY